MMSFLAVSRALDRTGFPRLADSETEARKFALLRVVVGLLLAWRSGIIARDAVYYFDPTFIVGRGWPLEAIAGGTQFMLSLGLVFGVLPRTCAALLMLTHAAFSVWTETYNLAPMLLVPILGAIFVLDSGRLALHGRLRLAPPPEQFRAVYLILFLAYAGWSFGAVLNHVRDPYWIQGRTTEVMFINSYLSEFYGLFRAWELASPGSLHAMSIFVGCAQTLFQLAMIPLMLSVWGAVYVRVWGWIFILGSVVDLQLSLLPFVEVVMWTTVFVPATWLAWAGGKAQAPASAADSLKWGGSRYRAAVFTAGYGTLSLLFFTNALLAVAAGRPQPAWYASAVLFYAGLGSPNVFNTLDLTMGDRWTVLTRIDGERSELVPFDGPEGERLDYLRSDLLYFGNSLRWRREMIFADDLARFHQPGGLGYARAYRVARYDHLRRGGLAPERYQVTVFRNYAADRAGLTAPACYTPRKIYEFTLVIGADSSVARAADANEVP